MSRHSKIGARDDGIVPVENFHHSRQIEDVLVGVRGGCCRSFVFTRENLAKSFSKRVTL